MKPSPSTHEIWHAPQWAELQRVIDSVADGTFSPDAERSMVFKERECGPVERPPQCVKQELVVEDGFVVIP